MSNTNCLEGVKCPECGQEDKFEVAGQCLFVVTDHGAEAKGDIEYNDHRFAVCPVCDFEGTWGDFKVNNQKPKTIYEITITSASWGYTYTLPKMGELKSGVYDGHTISKAYPDNRIQMGRKVTYGTADNDGKQYITVAVGERGGGAVIGVDDDCSLLYGPHMFLWGTAWSDGEDGRDMTRAEIIELLQAIPGMSLPASRSFYNDVWVHRGYKKGIPTFYRALKADANSPATLFAVQHVISAASAADEMPDGYQCEIVPKQVRTQLVIRK